MSPSGGPVMTGNGLVRMVMPSVVTSTGMIEDSEPEGGRRPVVVIPDVRSVPKVVEETVATESPLLAVEMILVGALGELEVDDGVGVIPGVRRVAEVCEVEIVVIWPPLAVEMVLVVAMAGVELVHGPVVNCRVETGDARKEGVE